MKKYLVLFFVLCLAGAIKAQFSSSNEVYAYIKAGESLDSKPVIQCYIFKDNAVYWYNPMYNVVTQTYKNDPTLSSLFLGSDGRLKRGQKRKYDGSNSTSARTTYVDQIKTNQYSSYWGYSGDFNRYYSFSKDRESLIMWESNSNIRVNYVRIKLSEFAPKTQNRDFLYE